MLSILLRLSCVLLLATSASAQVGAPRAAWVSLSAGGAGSTAFLPRAGPALFIGRLQYQQPLGAGPILIQGGVSGAADLLGGAPHFSEAHVALGAQARVGPYLLSATAGPSVVRALRSGRRDETRILPGLHVGGEALLVVAGSVGVGVSAFGTLNAALPAGGVGVSLAFGRLRGAHARR